MKRKDQIKFVRELTKSIGDSIIQKIQDGSLPEEWDGIEIRALLAQKAESATCPMHPKRKNNFRNTNLVNNL